MYVYVYVWLNTYLHAITFREKRSTKLGGVQRAEWKNLEKGNGSKKFCNYNIQNKRKNHFLCNSRGPLQKTTTKILSFKAQNNGNIYSTTPTSEALE